MIKVLTIWVLTVVFSQGSTTSPPATTWQLQYQNQESCINAAKKYVRLSKNSITFTYHTYCDSQQIFLAVPETTPLAVKGQGVKTK